MSEPINEAMSEAAGTTIQVWVNGESRDVPAGLDVVRLLKHLNITAGRIAIERNLNILAQADWARTEVAEGDRYEIVHLVGGG
jgi:thiamine biosynthesis protein ThiS